MSSRTMIRIDAKPRLFNLRVAGLAFRDGHILVHRATHELFWTFPGGRGEIGEDSAETLRREMREELDVDAQVERLLWTVENFFHFEGRDYHELGFYYLMHLPDHFAFQPDRIIHRIVDGPNEIEFKWVKADPLDLKALPLQPDFIQDRVRALPERSEHLIWREVVPE
jgi:8-oxo-dGTP pyrophosphatase MutT (NUDIX family)